MSMEISQQNQPLGVGLGLHLTDQQSIISYLLPKKQGNGSLADSFIAEVDFYEWDPWDLPSKSKIRSDEGEWFFFNRQDKVRRMTKSGRWKITGKRLEIKNENFACVGSKRYLRFESDKADLDGIKWVMHEYSVSLPGQPNFVLCRLMKKIDKKNVGRPCGDETPNLEDLVSKGQEKDNAGPLDSQPRGSLGSSITEEDMESWDFDNPHKKTGSEDGQDLVDEYLAYSGSKRGWGSQEGLVNDPSKRSCPSLQ